LWGRKGEAFCVRPFAVYGQQPENDKQSVDFAPPGKIPPDAHARRGSMNRGAFRKEFWQYVQSTNLQRLLKRVCKLT